MITLIHMITDITNIIKTGLLEKLKIHHGLYSLPCTSEYLEELIATILTENGYKNDWKPNRKHTASIDIKLDAGLTFSIKSGEYFPNRNTLKFSGSRLGKYDDISDMVSSIIDNSADYYICLAKVKKDWIDNTRVYYLFVFPASCLHYNSDWQKTESGKNHRYDMNITGMKATIHSSMSSQLWTWVSTDIIGLPDKLNI